MIRSQLARPVALAFAASLLTLAQASAAQATKPTIQLVHSIPIGAAQAVTSFTAFGITTMMAADGDPNQPWLIKLLHADFPDASVTRIGPVGLVPTTPIEEVDFNDPAEPHPLAAVVGMSDGYVYRWDGATGECVWKTYIGRTTATKIHFPGCVGEVAATDIQCPNESDSVVGKLYGYVDTTTGSSTTSTLFAPTAYAQVTTGDDPWQCGLGTGNRVYALNAATGEPSWVFNTDKTSPTPYAVSETTPYQVQSIIGVPLRDLWDDSCSGGVNRQQIIFGTTDDGSGLDTLFSVSTAPETAGQVNWSGPAGGLELGLTPPFFGFSKCHHAYAVTSNGGSFESIGITPDACPGTTVPCFTAPPMQMFVFTKPIAQPQPVYDGAANTKIVVADQSTVHVLEDDGTSISTYCNAAALNVTYPEITGAPLPYSSAVWLGAKDQKGAAAIVGLRIPAAKPAAPFDCGTSYAALPQDGTVGDVFFDSDMASPGTPLLETVVVGPTGSRAVTMTFTE